MKFFCFALLTMAALIGFNFVIHGGPGSDHAKAVEMLPRYNELTDREKEFVDNQMEKDAEADSDRWCRMEARRVIAGVKPGEDLGTYPLHIEFGAAGNWECGRSRLNVTVAAMRQEMAKE